MLRNPTFPPSQLLTQYFLLFSNNMRIRKEDKKEFHPGDLIYAIIIPKHGFFSPNQLSGVRELMEYMLNLKRVSTCSLTELNYLLLKHNELFRSVNPSITIFADGLIQRNNFLEIFKSIEKTQALINEIEQRFGSMITIETCLNNISISRPKL